MNEMWAPVKLLLKPKRQDAFNFTFNLHTKYTVVILLACSLMMCAQFAREPITCLPGSKLINEKVFDAFCWVNGTFTYPHLRSRNFGNTLLAPGVGISYNSNAPRQYQKYYQWLSIILVLQACLFYLPRYLWKVWQGNVLMALLPSEPAKNATENGSGGGGGDEKAQQSAKMRHRLEGIAPQLVPLVRFFNSNSHYRRAYVTRFVVCEMLNACNVVTQAFLATAVFGRPFLYYGYNVVAYSTSSDVDWEHTVSPMDEVFPKVAKCDFYKYGSSGTIENVDGLCVLGWNIIYDKIYFVMWWWFVVLLVFTVVNLVCRFLTFFVRPLRAHVLGEVAFFSAKSTVRQIVHARDFADMFVLCKLGKQMKPEIFDHLLQELNRTSCETSVCEKIVTTS